MNINRRNLIVGATAVAAAPALAQVPVLAPPPLKMYYGCTGGWRATESQLEVMRQDFRKMFNVDEVIMVPVDCDKPPEV